jgi:hypothetical protein
VFAPLPDQQADRQADRHQQRREHQLRGTGGDGDPVRQRTAAVVRPPDDLRADQCAPGRGRRADADQRAAGRRHRADGQDDREPGSEHHVTRSQRHDHGDRAAGHEEQRG